MFFPDRCSLQFLSPSAIQQHLRSRNAFCFSVLWILASEQRHRAARQKAKRINHKQPNHTIPYRIPDKQSIISTTTMILPVPMAQNRWFAAAMALWMKRDGDCDCTNLVPTTSTSTPGSSKDEQAATKRQLPANTLQCRHRLTAANANANPNANPNANANANPNATTASTMVLRILRATVAASVVATLCFAALYRAVSAPPLQLWYDRAPDAGPSSVYLPGGGFSGFWFHLGYLHALAEGKHRHSHNHNHSHSHSHNYGNDNGNGNGNGNGNSEHGDLHDYDYYCYSSACLGILSVFLNRSLEDVYGAALASQNAWIDGNQSRFEIVDYFFEQLVPPEEHFAALYNYDDNDNDDDDDNDDALPLGTSSNATDLFFLPRIKILVTTASEGYRVVESRTRTELKENIRKTTFVPFLTGWGWFFRSDSGSDSDSSNGFVNGSSNLDIDIGIDIDNDNEVYLDGGFSRVLHPRCEAEWHLPVLWDTLIHTFSPGLSREQVQTLWESGYAYTQFPLPSVPRSAGASTSASAGAGASVCTIENASTSESTNASRTTGGASEPAATETIGRKTNTKSTVVSNAGTEPGQRTHTQP